jgi:acetyltransferase
MELMLDYARSEGLNTVEGQVLRENSGMLAMCRELGFKLVEEPGSGDITRVVIKLNRSSSEDQNSGPGVECPVEAG